jgi:hypothetical protein
MSSNSLDEMASADSLPMSATHSCRRPLL